MLETDWVAMAAVAGVVTAAGTVAMAIAIVVTARLAKGTLEAAREDSRARTRPVMVAELQRELLAHGSTLLVVKNLGSSVAKQVELHFDPHPPNDVGALGEADMMKWIYDRYSTPVTTWAPGWVASNVIRSGHEEISPLTVTIKYQGPDGTRYEDPYFLNPDHVMKETESNPSKTDDPIKLEQQKVSALQALVRTIRHG